VTKQEVKLILNAPATSNKNNAFLDLQLWFAESRLLNLKPADIDSKEEVIIRQSKVRKIENYTIIPKILNCCENI
jgi:hypothetical protein